VGVNRKSGAGGTGDRHLRWQGQKAEPIMRIIALTTMLLALASPLAAQEIQGDGESGRSTEVNVPGGPSITISDQSSGSLGIDIGNGDLAVSGGVAVGVNDLGVGIGGGLDTSPSSSPAGSPPVGAGGSTNTPTSGETRQPGIALSAEQIAESCDLVDAGTSPIYRCNGQLYRLQPAPL
jgi:hypothetical protein